MKTIVEINSINYSSTGNITLNIAKEARKQGYKVYTACKKSKVGLKFKYDDQIYIGTRLERILSEWLSYITGLKDHFNLIGTYFFIKRLKQIKPDLIHLHSLTDTYINLHMLFKYISSNNIPVIWTFHDAWAFTGQCFVFESVGCEKWKTGCGKCPQLHEKPASLFLDNTKYLWNKKKEMFTSLKTLTIVTPSNWLANLTKQSFFSKYPITIINNGINNNIFKPTKSNFREKYNIQDKFVVLGVASKWWLRKGLDIFINLAKDLPTAIQIVMVGTNDEIDKQLPSNIISIHKTFNQEELAQIYTAADLFVNPTREDNFPTVNIESLSCGTPVITFKTGGSTEIIDETCGKAVTKNDYDKLKEEIIKIYHTKPYTKEDCLKRASLYKAENKYQEYINLFNKYIK